MKVLIIGSDKIFAIENYYVKYLKEFGIDVCHFPAQRIFLDHYSKSVLNKIIFKVGISSLYKEINDEFKKEVEQFEPDVIWVFKGMEIFPESLQWAMERNIKLVNYNPDNPFLFSGKGSGNKNIIQALAIYDLHLTYNLQVKEQIEKEYHIKVEMLPFGFEVNDALYTECCGMEEINKLCFLGNPDKFRAEFIKQLARFGIKIDVYGNNWSKFIRHPNINIFNPVGGDIFWKILRQYRVQLNLMRPHNPESHNMRSFEVPGIGGIQLAPDTPDHQKYFEPGKEIFLYSGLQDAVKQIQELLNLSDEQSNGIRNQARHRSVISGYSYKERTKQALEAISKI